VGRSNGWNKIFQNKWVPFIAKTFEADLFLIAMYLLIITFSRNCKLNKEKKEGFFSQITFLYKKNSELEVLRFSQKHKM